ncbi:MAG: LssY C-terminal domain-containing protein [bacterium]|nr:LssY C-terminal domain-containing protein [bacterium]
MNSRSSVEQLLSRQIPARLAVLLGALLLYGCASYEPAPASYQPHLDRKVTKTNGLITASAATLSREEAEKMFGVPLHKKGIQPVWVRLENAETKQYYFLPASLDANYYSPAEVAYLFRKACRPKRNRQVADFMDSKRIQLTVPPESAVEGFVFCSYDAGVKYVLIDLIGQYEHRRLEFTVPVPGGHWDFEHVDFKNLYPGVEVKDCTLEELPAVLRALPATTTDKKGKGSGDPLNLVVVCKVGTAGLALLRQGWDPTEALTVGTTFRLVRSFLLALIWRTSPVSSLYVFGRCQDFAMQKARSTIHGRNHLRLWLAPFTCEGRLVFIGQISRDIGLRFTTKAPGWFTHKIDPEVDEVREYLAQEMLISGSVDQIAWVGGVGEVPRDEPRGNLTGDPYYTDGARVVLFLSEEWTSPDKVHLIDWLENVEPLKQQSEANVSQADLKSKRERTAGVTAEP